MGKTPFDEARRAATRFASGLVNSLMYIHAAEELERQAEEVAEVTEFLRGSMKLLRVTGSVGDKSTNE